MSKVTKEYLITLSERKEYYTSICTDYTADTVYKKFHNCVALHRNLDVQGYL